MIKYLVTICSLLLLFSSCKKDDEEPKDTVTINNVSGNYKITGFSAKQGPITYDIFSTWPSCAKDDIMNLKSDKTYTWPDSGEKCTGSTDETGTWDLEGTTKFKWNGDTYNIDNFDGKDFKFSVSDTDSSGQVVSLIFEFQKQ
jgi:hypothetical protein